MTTATATETGAYLARLREKAGLKQNELASKVTWSPAVLSRVESGERPLSAEERDSILDAIGTEKALDFKETVERVWQHLDRPPLGHPDEQILWEGEQALQRVTDLAESPDIKNVFAERLKTFGSELKDAARLVSKTEHNIAFVGKRGVGKTTALCRIAGLEVSKDGKSEPLLETAGGGTTVCEVRVMQGSGYGFYVEPMKADEFHREVLEFASSFTKPLGEEPEQVAGEEDSQGTSTEIDRAIRNMSGLTRIPILLPDGKRQRIDPVAEMAKDFPDPNTLTGEILSRIRPQERTGRRLWYPEISGKEQKLWLKETFEQLNNGRHPEFSLPTRIDIVVPEKILGEEDMSVCLVDTKGIYATAERADLEAHFNDRHAVVMLCSSFADAPSNDVQSLLRRAVDGGFADMGTQAAVLVLPRHDEASDVKDDQGNKADDTAEGYILKGEDARSLLEHQNLPYADMEFFNAREDDLQPATNFLLRLIQGVRNMHRIRLEEVIDGANALVANFAEAQVQEVYQQAARPVWRWLENNQEIDGLTGSLEGNLIVAINGAYASSVRASVRRQGDWYNLNYSHHLGYGARVMAARSVVPKLENFRSRIEIILENEELKPAFDLIGQSRRILEDGVNTLLIRSELLGKRIYIQHLKPDSEFWGLCDSRWGQGYGYRDDVAQYHKSWFSNSDRDFQAMVQELVEREWRQILARLSAILDPEATEAIAA